MTTHVNVAGVWRDASPAGLSTRVSGTWRNVATAYVKVAGVWRVCYQSDQAGPAAVVSPVAQFLSGSGTNVQVDWTNPADADISFVRVSWFVGAPGSPVSTQDVAGTPSQARSASFAWGAVTSNVYVQLTPYDTSGNPGPTTQIDPSNIRTSAPQNFGVAAWSYSTITVSWQPPAFGTVTNYTVELRNEAGSPITQVTTGLLNVTFAVSEDTKYQIALVANSPGGASPAPTLKPWIGHSEIGSWQPVYGWSPTVTSVRPVDGGASTAASGYPTSNLYDTAPGTQWRSSGTFGSEGPLYWETFRFYSPGGNRKLVSVSVNGDPNHKYYLGAQQTNSVWVGPYLASLVGMASSGFPYDAAQIYHDYLAESYDPYTSAWKVCEAEAFGLVLQNFSFFNIAITRLVNDGSNWKAIAADVFISYKDWVQTGSTWVVSRTAQANTYW